MEKHILFFDIDGTIYFHGRIPLSVLRAIKKAQKAGHYVVINTGRSKISIPKIITKKIKWDGFICGGSYVEFHNKVLSCPVISREIMSELIKIIDRNKIPTVFDGVAPSRSLYFPVYRPALHSSQEVFDTFEESKVYKLQVCKVMTKEEIEEFGKYVTVYPMGHYADVFLTGCGKGVCIKKVCEETGIPVERTIAFGDNNNDLQMLQMAGRSVAMKRAPKNVSDAATFTATKRLSGVAQGIQKLLFE